MINLLIDDLPDMVEIDGQCYPVNWGFRAMMLIEICMFDTERNDEQKILDALNIFYGENIPENFSKAMDCLMWFYRCGKEEKKSGKKGVSKKQARRCYCYNQDAPYIYAAFLTQYGLDLNNTKNYDLHWWRFHAMFESLDEDLKISKIMYYRTASTSGCSKGQRRFLNEMKKLYALDTDSQDMDDKMRLTKRDAEMKAYVRKRAMETYGANAESEVP